MAEIENLQIGTGTIHIVGNQDIIAAEWEAGQAYVKNSSYCIHDHLFYKCNTTHTSVAPFDPTKWTEMKVCEALGSLPQAGGDRDSLRYDSNNVEWIAEPTTISLTTAEYEALENDGDLVPQTSYILTDAPALEYTANDLSYDGTATTTKQVIDGLSPTAYSNATRSTALSSGVLAYFKIGKVVICNMQYVTNTANVTTHDTILFTDLPSPIANLYVNLVDDNSHAVRVRVATDGKMYLHYSSITANKEINGTFAYISS